MAVEGGGDGVRDQRADGIRDGGAVRGFIPWIMAVAEEPRDSWLEKRKRNPKRMGELSQAAFW
jgi:hypothetical protein